MSHHGNRDEEELKQEWYYHGLLSRDDLAQMLPNLGDFLVRLTQVNTNGKFEFVVSVRANNGMRHFVMRKDEKGLYTLRNDPRFDTPLKLLNHHRNHNIPADRTDKSTLLQKAIPKQAWELSHAMVKLEKKLGEGQFGDVYSGTLQRTPEAPKIRVAIKSSKIKKMDKAMVLEITKEARMVRALEHPNVVKLHGVVVESEPLLIVMELVNGGSLDKYLVSNKNIPQAERVRMCMDVARGLQYVHAKGLVHRDIAARNCLYNGKMVKIGDFGLSTQVNSMTNAQEKLPIKWLSPEVLARRHFSDKSDVYAYGVLVWEVFANGQQPYAGMSTAEVQKGVIKGKHMKMPTRTPYWLSKIITLHVWEPNPVKRYNMTDVIRAFHKNAHAPPQSRSPMPSGHSQSLRASTSKSRPDVTGSHTARKR